MTPVLDTKPYIEYDPLIGYRYRPNVRQVLARPGGGRYEFTTNSEGIRALRNYSKGKPEGVLRILVLGDSYAAGQFVSNDQRFSELLERRVAGLEVINFALEGTGTDQQLLIYEQAARHYEHDLVLLLPFLQNIRRNMADFREGYDPATRERMLRGKPRFVLIDDELELRNVPVPTAPLRPAGNTSAPPVVEDDLQGRFTVLKSRLNRSRLAAPLKKVLYNVLPWEPFPEYRNSSTPEWRLMAAIIERFKKTALGRPLVIAPVFYDSYILYRMARNYLDRFRSLEQVPGIHVIDLLPHFKRMGQAAGAFLSPYDCHFSAYGHIVLAEAVQTELTRRGFLK